MKKLHALLEAQKVVTWMFVPSTGFIELWGPGTFGISGELVNNGFKFAGKVWEAKMSISTFGEVMRSIKGVKFQRG